MRVIKQKINGIIEANFRSTDLVPIDAHDNGAVRPDGLSLRNEFLTVDVLRIPFYVRDRLCPC